MDIVGYQHCRFEDSPDDRCCKVPVCDSANHPNDDYDDSSVGKASSHGRTFGFPEFNVTCSDHTGLPHKVRRIPFLIFIAEPTKSEFLLFVKTKKCDILKWFRSAL